MLPPTAIPKLGLFLFLDEHDVDGLLNLGHGVLAFHASCQELVVLEGVSILVEIAFGHFNLLQQLLHLVEHLALRLGHSPLIVQDLLRLVLQIPQSLSLVVNHAALHVISLLQGSRIVIGDNIIGLAISSDMLAWRRSAKSERFIVRHVERQAKRLAALFLSR